MAARTSMLWSIRIYKVKRPTRGDRGSRRIRVARVRRVRMRKPRLGRCDGTVKRHSASYRLPLGMHPTCAPTTPLAGTGSEPQLSNSRRCRRRRPHPSDISPQPSAPDRAERGNGGADVFFHYVRSLGRPRYTPDARTDDDRREEQRGGADHRQVHSSLASTVVGQRGGGEDKGRGRHGTEVAIERGNRLGTGQLASSTVHLGRDWPYPEERGPRRLGRRRNGCSFGFGRHRGVEMRSGRGDGGT